MKLTFKIQRDAAQAMESEFNARAEKCLRKFRLRDRVETHKRSPEGRAETKIQAQKDFALALGCAYHRNISKLVQSQYARVLYGPGGQDEKDWTKYSKSYKFPAEWKNAGARIEGKDIVIETSRGKVAWKGRLPRGAIINTPAETHGDLYSLRDAGNPDLVHRFGPDHKETGIAIRYADTYPEWEHGKTIEDCEREHAAKIELKRKWIREHRASSKEERRLRLLARLSDKIMVTRDDAAATGSCRAGIEGWCARAGITDDDAAIPARRVIQLAVQTGERRAIAAAIHAARNALARVTV